MLLMTAKNVTGGGSLDMMALASKGTHYAGRNPSVPPHNDFSSESKVSESEPECLKEWRGEKTDKPESYKLQGSTVEEPDSLAAQGGIMYQNLYEAPKLSTEAVMRVTGVMGANGKRNNPLLDPQYPPPSHVKCCGGKVKRALVVLLLVTGFLSLFMFSMASCAKIYRLGKRVKNLEEMSERILKDLDMYNDSKAHETMTMSSKLNDTVFTVESLGAEIFALKAISLSQLVSSKERMMSQISNLQQELLLLNETHALTQSQLESVNSGLSSLSVRVDTLLLPQLTALQSMQDVAQSELDSLSNKLNITGTKVDTLSSRVSENQFQLSIIRETLLTQLNVTSISLESLKNSISTENSARSSHLTIIGSRLDITEANLTLLASQVSQLQLTVDATNVQVNRAQSNITSMRSDQNVTRQSLNQAKTSLNSMESRFSSMSRVLRGLNSTIASPVNLYSRCYKDVVNCTVSLHQFTPFWYLCTTPSLRINAPVSLSRGGRVRGGSEHSPLHFLRRGKGHCQNQLHL